MLESAERGRARGDPARRADHGRGEARMAIDAKTFLYAHEAATGVATITLNRPELLNALTFEVYAELRDTFRALGEEPGVRAVLLTGSGRGFCSGGDVESIIG